MDYAETLKTILFVFGLIYMAIGFHRLFKAEEQVRKYLKRGRYAIRHAVDTELEQLKVDLIMALFQAILGAILAAFVTIQMYLF